MPLVRAFGARVLTAAHAPTIDESDANDVLARAFAVARLVHPNPTPHGG